MFIAFTNKFKQKKGFIMEKHILSSEKLKAGYNKIEILHGIDIAFPSNKISIIIGANACGKSTLLKSCVRLLTPTTGQILLDGNQIHKMNSKNIAKIMGLLPQSPIAPEGIKVFDLVSRGRFPYQSFMGGMTSVDFDAINEAIKLMGIEDIANKCVDELSGGQRQRVWIAMALAQQTDILLLDEPTTYLDIAHQIEILDLLKNLNKKKGTTIIMVLHEINLSARYADYMVALKEGELVTHGTPKDVIKKDLVKEVFDLTCEIIDDPVSKTPMIIPVGHEHILCYNGDS